ncbi:MAG TPA: cation acetate symporter [Jatrophihabitans sp.]|uniref:sodium/solute symporter n=1 Tax=Jatrophihabitans sp. TaxID=1932789 RepID=UPI002DF831FF|nr:cation acetate symporter [Jatrophihabitans sp.]
MTHGPASVVAVTLVVGATLVAGSLGLRRARTTSDFYVAARSVSPRWNAAAIGGEYLSAASYLGVAGLVLAYGFDMLWYPVCYTAGYLVLLALVAAPLRRSGAYTLPDFAQIRLGSPVVRRVASILVVLIGWLYLVPQLQGAALTLRTQTGAPGWVGGLLVALVVIAAVAVGGMRSITFAQALQFWLKFIALLLPALVLVGVWQHRHDGVGAGLPSVRHTTTVDVGAAITVRVPREEVLDVRGSVDGRAADGPVRLLRGEHRLGAHSRLTLRPGDAVPVRSGLPSQRSDSWLRPLGSGTAHPLYASLSLILAICLGTMGLPHVLVRFYTNSDGRDARRTTLNVLVLLSAFYLVPTIFGALGRAYVPDLLVTGNTDATVLALPERMLGGAPGVWLGALVTAGAFAAFLSTASGLTVSVAGVLTQDVLRRRVARPFGDGRARRIRTFRVAAVAAIAVPYLLSLPGGQVGLAAMVGLAFAVAAATFCPLLVLGIWWTRLTVAGTVAGLVTGGVLATAAVLVTVIGDPAGGWWAALLAQPGAWAVPISFGVMIAVSLATRRGIPPDTARVMVRLHGPEFLADELRAADRSTG